MAQKIKGDYTPPKKRGPKCKYPWDTWLNGERWRLEQGEDFQAELDDMERLIRRTAKKRGLATVVVNKEDDGLVVRAVLRQPKGSNSSAKRSTPNPKRK
jgi:hypothetical protein